MPAGGGVVIGPGPMTPAVRALVIANVAVFLLTFIGHNSGSQAVEFFLGLSPQRFFERYYLWTIVTYLFVHDPNGFAHILFNMLALWMFGVDLERRWGTRMFLRYYFITGVGAGIGTAVIALLPYAPARAIYFQTTVGASGAIYGLLVAWALLFPTRQILFMFIFPLQARIAALLMAGMAFLTAATGTNGSVAEATHLSGFVIGWVYLKGPRQLRLDLQYRLTKWRMGRMRKKFNVHQGGKDKYGNWVH